LDLFSRFTDLQILTNWIGSKGFGAVPSHSSGRERVRVREGFSQSFPTKSGALSVLPPEIVSKLTVSQTFPNDALGWSHSSAQRVDLSNPQAYSPDGSFDVLVSTKLY